MFNNFFFLSMISL
ncbi:hypothetical protein [Plasmodium yoelii yoelii]|uniref:Uncharacterized protein n=1 Tax=Plasmodium yoelii yoelii TaxID=73239 RepID=Q7R8X6_PLAYO|nr:hypothetical protein [Plasmodium yoelii yoelii]